VVGSDQVPAELPASEGQTGDDDVEVRRGERAAAGTCAVRATHDEGQVPATVQEEATQLGDGMSG